MNTAEIALDQIEVGERLRLVDPDHAALIAESFRANGQIQPIEVAKSAGGYRLIAGAHRLEAARLAGMPAILAIITEANELQARLREIDENLCRRELSELDRATFLSARREVWLDLHPETKRGGDRQKKNGDQNDNLVVFASFASATAEKLGISERSVQRAIRRHNSIMPDVRDRIATSWIAGRASELDALARLAATQQRRVVDAMLRAEAPVRSVSAALLDIGATRPPKAAELNELQYQALIRAWEKAGRAARRRFVDFLVAEGAIDALREAA